MGFGLPPTIMKLYGVNIEQPLPRLAEQYKGCKLIILGGSKSVWKDYLEANNLLNIPEDAHIMCINDIATQFKRYPITHAVSLHKEILRAVKPMRTAKSMMEYVHTHCHKPGADIENAWNMKNVGGTSGLFAMKISLLMGYSKIILCGISLDGEGHYFDPENANENRTTKFNDKVSITVWREFKEQSDGNGDKVRVMSGRLTSIYGTPTKEWLYGNG